jgi:hypothetical protein
VINMAYYCVSMIEPDHVPVGSSVTWDYYANFLHPKLCPKIIMTAVVHTGLLIIHHNARHHIKQITETIFTHLQSECTVSLHLIVLIKVHNLISSVS